MAVESNISKAYFREVGFRIQKKRKQKGLSLEKLGLEIGLTRMQVHRIEMGYNITLKTVLKLAIALECNPATIVKSSQKLRKEDLDHLITISKSTSKLRK